MANLKKDTDIVFLIDTSVSMGSYISRVNSVLNNFADSLKGESVSFRLGLVEFEASATAYEFTNDVEQFKSNLSNLSISGGTENGLTALKEALGMNFREGVTKRFIMLTDEDYDDDYYYEDDDDDSIINSDTIILNLNNAGVVLDVVGSVYDGKAEYEPIANATGGNFYDIRLFDYINLFDEIAASIVNVNVNLQNVGENQTGVFIVNEVANADGTTTIKNNAIFKAAAEAGDILVGKVTADKVYSAESDTEYTQNITIPENWNVTATKNDDRLNITGNNVSVTGSAGSDTFVVGSGISSVNFADFTTGEDNIKFNTAIPEHSLTPSASGNPFVLSSDNINLSFQNISTPSNAFYNTNVTNGTNTDTIIKDLIVSNYDAITGVTVDLNKVGESTSGVFTINPILGGEVSTDTANNAIFKAAAEDEDTVVGHVTADKVYISAAGSTYRQNIIIPENWKVTATDYNDYLNITGDNASIMGGNGSDTFAVGNDVSVVKFADFKTEEDNITFSTAIPEHSLTPSTSGRPFTLSSYDINLAFQNMSNPNEAFYNKNITNGSDTNIISDLIVFDYDAITAVNINLAKAGNSTDGVFVVNPVIAGKNNKNITSDAIFKDEAEGNEIVVGNITDEKIYVAETSTPYNQNITIPRNWDVTATTNNDYLNITGNNASVAGGAGVDNFYVASGVSNVNFVDFTPNEDYLAFADMIPEASLKESSDTGELSLFSDNINLNFQNMPYLTTDLALTSVGNGSTQNTVQQLIANPNIGVTINPTAPVMMSFSHWSYGFNPPTE